MVLDKITYILKWTSRFQPNDTFQIKEEDLVEFVQDTADSFEGGTGSLAPRRTPVYFYGQQLVAVPYTGAFPPLWKVFNEDDYEIACQVRINRFDKTLDFQFAGPTTGMILF